MHSVDCGAGESIDVQMMLLMFEEEAYLTEKTESILEGVISIVTSQRGGKNVMKQWV